MVTPSCDRMMSSRDACTPRALSDQDEQEGGCPGIFRPRRMHLAAMTAAQSLFGKLPMSAKGQKVTSPYDRSQCCADVQ